VVHQNISQPKRFWILWRIIDNPVKRNIFAPFNKEKSLKDDL
jgi:hypothetical protein